MKNLRCWGYHFLMVFLPSLLWSILWFRPLFTHPKMENLSLLEKLEQIFFLQTTPELLVGKGVDLYGSIWMVEQVKKMLMEGGSSFLADMYYPIGFNLGENTGYAWFDAALGAPFAEWLGTPGFWNLHVLVVCTLSISSLIILFKQFDLSYALCIGLAFLCFTNPFMVDELNLGRPTQISIWPLALLLAVFVRVHISGFTAWYGILAGLFTAMACLTYWFTGIALGFCLVFLFLVQLLQAKDKWRGVIFGVLGIITTIGIVFPITWPMTSRLLSGQIQHSYRKLLGKPDHIYSWLPLQLQTEYSISTWSDLVYVFKASCQFMPFFIVIILCSLLPYGRKWKIPWIGLWVFTLGMSLSSGLNILGWHVPTGLAVLEWLFPPMLRCQFEGRNVVVANLIGFSIVGFTLMALKEKQIFSAPRSAGAVILSIIFFGLAFRLLPDSNSLAVTEFQTPTALNQQLKKKQGAIIELPLMASNYTFVHQMYHNLPIFGGMGFDTVRPIKHKTYTKNHPSIQKLLTTFKKSNFNQPLSEQERQYLVEDGFAWVLVYPEFTMMPIERWGHFLGVDGMELEGVWVFSLVNH